MRTGFTAQTFLLVTLTGCLIPVVMSRGDLVDREHAAVLNIFPRQASASAPANTSPAAAASPATSETPTSQAASTTAAAPASSTVQQQQPSSTAAQPSSTAQQQSSSVAPATSAAKSSEAASSAAAPPTTVTSALVTTNPGGQVITSIVVVADTPTPSAKPSQSAAGSNNSSSNSGSSGISTSTIIGLSVAGGVAVLCVVGFFVWKFTRKRMGDYDNNEEIKWPELNAHDTGVPLPTNRTGGAGFDTGLETGRSSVGYAPSTAANSTAELQPDPYAIPALPHLDPNQPYRDDPSAAYYDPYRGPIPQSFSPIGPGPGEVIPMTQLAGAGRRSPGPGAAYAGDFASGRVSPGPGAAYAGDFASGRASPGLGMHAAYSSADYDGRASPGPRAAPQGRSMSPGPQAAYGNAYGPR